MLKKYRSLIKYSKDIQWLIPFVESASSLVDLTKIKSIKSYKVKKGLNERQYGSTIKNNSGYTINLLAYNWSRASNKYKGTTITILLDTLAHELAHTKEFQHNYKHFRIQSLILQRFSYIIQDMDIKDVSIRFNNLDTHLRGKKNGR